ncbi:MAG: 30S ribosomal protein S16 [Thermoguttaceae bacterium]|nr:30S ribosomal protein S16 [Planctomycetaceae bacterium]MBQ4143231.1 30S ribosomal protein S16 [Thermoguttaceae bacterium]
MAVRIRMKKLGRLHRPFYRICAMDSRAPRGGRVLQELGTYDPMVPETDARVVLDVEGVEKWLAVGAQPTPKVAVLIKKYGKNGTHLEAQKAAQAKLAEARKPRPTSTRMIKAQAAPAVTEEAAE